jgi:hypothetical protein
MGGLRVEVLMRSVCWGIRVFDFQDIDEEEHDVF